MFNKVMNLHELRDHARAITDCGRWGRKVFIYALEMRARAADPDINLGALRARLIDLARAGQVRLTRTDLPSEMPRVMVDRSLLLDRGAEFHLLEIPTPTNP